MTEEELQALTAVQFNSAVSPEDVWSPLTYHVSDLHANVAATVINRLREADRGRKPIGVVLEGGRGVGKTHMLRWARQEVQRGGATSSWSSSWRAPSSGTASCTAWSPASTPARATSSPRPCRRSAA